MTSYWSPFKIHLSQKVWWYPLHGACTHRINVPMTTIKKHQLPKQRKHGSIEAKNFRNHRKQWPITTLHGGTTLPGGRWWASGGRWWASGGCWWAPVGAGWARVGAGWALGGRWVVILECLTGRYWNLYGNLELYFCMVLQVLLWSYRIFVW